MSTTVQMFGVSDAGGLKYFIQQGRLLKSGSKKVYFKVVLLF